jgi:uncharacterized repeat protein (TIGR03803 family)
MTSPRFPSKGFHACMLALSMGAAALPAAASEFTVLHSFSVTDGYYPRSTLAIDSEGNLYGSTVIGGPKGEGTLFKIGAQGFSTLYAFDFAHGSSPGGRLTIDAGGTLWGTTSDGGRFGGGTAFSLDPGGHLRFVSLKGGAVSGLTRGPDGAFYGVTFGDLGQKHGSVYRFDPQTFTVLTVHRFDGHDGNGPRGELLSDNGRLYGTASAGGHEDRGTAFELDPMGTGFFARRTDHGGWIDCGLTLDAQGRAWGVASVDKPLPGGAGKGSGGIYSIDAMTGKITVGHRFAEDFSEGLDVEGNLLLARDGRLYGMTILGGKSGFGTIFRFDPATDAFEVLHDFSGKADDGSRPYSGLSQDASGAFYGTTTQGGANDAGVAFRFVP